MLETWRKNGCPGAVEQQQGRLSTLSIFSGDWLCCLVTVHLLIPLLFVFFHPAWSPVIWKGVRNKAPEEHHKKYAKALPLMVINIHTNYLLLDKKMLLHTTWYHTSLCVHNSKYDISMNNSSSDGCSTCTGMHSVVQIFTKSKVTSKLNSYTEATSSTVC